MQYETFCSGESGEQQRDVSVETADVTHLAHALSEQPESTLLVDVRSKTEYGICSLKPSTSECLVSAQEANSEPRPADLPLETILESPRDTLGRLLVGRATRTDLYFVCRRGNDSLIAASAARQALGDESANVGRIVNVIGGVRAWSRDVDPNFPVY